MVYVQIMTHEQIDLVLRIIAEIANGDESKAIIFQKIRQMLVFIFIFLMIILVIYVVSIPSNTKVNRQLPETVTEYSPFLFPVS